MVSKRKEEPARALADALRGSKGVDYATAKLEGEEGEATWVDYCRRKDLLKHLAADPALAAPLIRPGMTPEEAAAVAVEVLVGAKLLLPAARRFKKPKPGRKKLVKWPRTLEAARGEGDGDEVFYAWSYDRPTSAWFYVASAALVVGALCVTLFPLAPHRLRLVVLYSLLALLGSLTGLILVRYPVWAATWILTGADFWLLPNLTSDKLPITEIFSPLVTWERHPGGLRHALGNRAAMAAGILLLGAGLYLTGPDAEGIKDSVKEAHDGLLNYFDLMGMNRTSIAGNTTQAANASTPATNDSSSSSSSSGAPAAGSPPGKPGAGSATGAAAGGSSTTGQQQGQQQRGSKGSGERQKRRRSAGRAEADKEL